MEYKFKVNDEVMITNQNDACLGLIGRIVQVDTFDNTFKVRFEEDNYEWDWYNECDLELVKTASETLESPRATSVSPEVNKVVVEPPSSLPDASTGTKNDSGKLRFDLLPADSIQEVVQVITYGETKYPSVEIEGKKVQNWKVLPDNENRLFAATMRHLWQHRSGELLDQETKLKHLAHAASSLMFLINIENEKAAVKQAENES